MSEIRNFKFEGGSLEYLFENKNQKKAVVLLHGYGASMHDLFDLQHYFDPDKKYDFIFPNGLLPLQMGFGTEGRAWFPIDMQELEKHMRQGSHRDFGAITPIGLEATLDTLKKFLASLFSEYDEIVLGGFSQGAMLTSLLLKEFNGKIKRAIFLSGNIIAKDHLGDARFDHLNFIQSHGKEDPVLGVVGARLLFDEFTKRGAKGDLIEFTGGHEIPMEVISKTQAFLKKD